MGYKIGWRARRDGVWRYFVVDTTSEMLDEVADKILIGDKVTVTEVTRVKMEQEEE